MRYSYENVVTTSLTQKPETYKFLQRNVCMKCTECPTILMQKGKSKLEREGGRERERELEKMKNTARSGELCLILSHVSD
jgi:NADH:ubiquinone oxidoreductase subunit F (NADH-binding)